MYVCIKGARNPKKLKSFTIPSTIHVCVYIYFVG